MLSLKENIFVFLSLLLLLISLSTVKAAGNRRELHQPFFPTEPQPPLSSPQGQPQPKHPYSTTPTAPQKSFFPTLHSPPPAPESTATPTFPANISSILIPRPSSSAHHRRLLIAVAGALLAVAGVVALVSTFLLLRHRNRLRVDDGKTFGSDNIRLFPPNTGPSDSPAGGECQNSDEAGNGDPRISSSYHKLGSPELRPLPPLPRRKSEGGSDNEEEEFFSPRGSSLDRNELSPPRNESSTVRNDSSSRRAFGGIEGDNVGSRSCNSRTASYPFSNSISPAVSNLSSVSQGLNISPGKMKSKSGLDLSRSLSASSLEGSLQNVSHSPKSNLSHWGHNEGNLDSSGFRRVKLPPPPPPLPPPRFWENPKASRPAVVMQINGGKEKKLKPLHWDTVRASSDRAMVWDQLKTSSFQLNEERIETLFTLSTSSLNPKDNARRPVVPLVNRENRVLDPKKSQNIAILLRALNVTVDEVCEALLEGNADTLGAELLESLLKMAPSSEEERKLKEFTDESPIKLGPAEKFLKEVINIPFAFERVDGLLYVANFDSEVEYLRRSFDTLKAACVELKDSRMFLKLLEAVLKTGNRMNVGTNRGDAQAFKLDTLLKLVDIKGTDGKTTLLHFVVQEIIRAEGSRLAGVNKISAAEHCQQSDLRDDVEYRKLGLQVVAGLSGELTNVKKAASMDYDVLTSEVSKLAEGISGIAQVVKLDENAALKESHTKFSESMNRFLKRAEAEIIEIKTQMRVAFSLVKEITQYFHGNSAKEEAHPFRIFMVVRDFLSILDRVCKEVGRINDRTTISTTRQFAVPVYPNIPPVFPGFIRRSQHGTSEDDDSSS